MHLMFAWMIACDRESEAFYATLIYYKYHWLEESETANRDF
jgi:hypothetical protein